MLGQGSYDESTPCLAVSNLSYFLGRRRLSSVENTTKPSFLHTRITSFSTLASGNMSLLDLPNEILGSIIDRLDPGDLDHFAESSPLLKRLATHALEVHHEREQKYTNIEVFGCHNHVGQHPLQLLGRICANPQLAWYPKSLKVECCGERVTEHNDGDFAPLINDEEFEKGMESDYFNEDYWESDVINVYGIIKIWAKTIRDLVFQSGYFDEEDCECWYNHIRNGNHEAIVGLLVTLLPNLETIESEAYTTRLDLVVKFVRCITGPPRESSKRTEDGARVLTKLRELRLRRWEYHTQSNPELVDFGLAGYFARLPSMRKICAVEADCRFFASYHHPWTQIESGSSSIDEVHLEDASMGTMSIVYCLRSLKALRKFSYDWSTGMWWSRRSEELAEHLDSVLAVIVDRFQSSLESLCLQGSDDDLLLKVRINTSISLGSFTKLTNARLPNQLFTSVPKAQPNTSSPIGDGENSETPNLPTLSRLVDTLPRSIEEVTFSGTIEMENIETMLSGLAEHKASRLPHLSKITFPHVYANSAPSTATATVLRSQCRRVGIDLIVSVTQ